MEEKNNNEIKLNKSEWFFLLTVDKILWLVFFVRVSPEEWVRVSLILVDVLLRQKRIIN